MHRPVTPRFLGPLPTPSLQVTVVFIVFETFLGVAVGRSPPTNEIRRTECGGTRTPFRGVTSDVGRGSPEPGISTGSGCHTDPDPNSLLFSIGESQLGPLLLGPHVSFLAPGLARDPSGSRERRFREVHVHVSSTNLLLDSLTCLPTHSPTHPVTYLFGESSNSEVLLGPRVRRQDVRTSPSDPSRQSERGRGPVTRDLSRRSTGPSTETGTTGVPGKGRRV